MGFALIKRIKEARAAHVKELAENPQDSSSGKTFRKLYKVGDKLGQGAFSVVKEATHRQSGKSFAIKIVNKYKLKPMEADALQIEIQLLRELDHNSIVSMYDVFDTPSDDYCYIVTEKILAGNLFDRIKQKGRYEEAEGRLATRTIFEAMAYTHKHDVAHRDLKLENLLMKSHTNDHDIKVIDFGFAKKVNSANGLKTFLGTPAYVAPCILEGVGYGLKADVWSLGVILYCMLGGYPPFRDTNREKLFRKIIKGKFEFDEPKWGDRSEEAKDLVRLLLTVDPSKRITAREALEHPWLAAVPNVDVEEEEKYEQ